MMLPHRNARAALLLAASSLAISALTAHSQTPPAPSVIAPMGAPVSDGADSGTLKRANRDMRRVIETLGTLGGKPIETLSAEEARKQPTPADAVAKIVKDDGKDIEKLKAGVKTQDVTYPGGDGTPQKARIYTPDTAASAPRPVILYIHGGGWVIADIDTYDATPRAIAKKADAIVVSIEYRHAPENKFPAAHDDSFAAWKWLLDQAKGWGADPNRVAILGESAGGNMAADVAIRARDEKVTMPAHMVLVYPVAGTDMTLPSYKDNEFAKPLNRAMMVWFADKTLKPEDKANPLIDLVGRADVKGLPPATIIAAEIDPLMSEGKQLADKLKAAGVEVKYQLYEGVTHEFFGMGAVVKDADRAEDLAANQIKDAFAQAASAAKPSLTESSGLNSAFGITPKTEDFVKEVAVSDMFELQSAALAQNGNAATKSFAAQMLTDHAKTTADLKSMAQSGKMKMELPTALTAAAQSKLDTLSKLQGSDFDKEYASEQIAAHKDVVSLFERYAKGGDNAELKSWASATLPTLQHHLAMAQELSR